MCFIGDGYFVDCCCRSLLKLFPVPFLLFSFKPKQFMKKRNEIKVELIKRSFYSSTSPRLLLLFWFFSALNLNELVREPLTMNKGKELSRVFEEISFFTATTASIKFNKEIDNNRISCNTKFPTGIYRKCRNTIVIFSEKSSYRHGHHRSIVPNLTNFSRPNVRRLRTK